LIITRNSAIAEVPRDSLCELKSCHHLRSCTKNNICRCVPS